MRVTRRTFVVPDRFKNLEEIVTIENNIKHLKEKEDRLGKSAKVKAEKNALRASQEALTRDLQRKVEDLVAEEKLAVTRASSGGTVSVEDRVRLLAESLAAEEEAEASGVLSGGVVGESAPTIFALLHRTPRSPGADLVLPPTSSTPAVPTARLHADTAEEALPSAPEVTDKMDVDDGKLGNPESDGHTSAGGANLLPNSPVDPVVRSSDTNPPTAHDVGSPSAPSNKSPPVQSPRGGSPGDGGEEATALRTDSPTKSPSADTVDETLALESPAPPNGATALREDSPMQSDSPTSAPAASAEERLALVPSGPPVPLEEATALRADLPMQPPPGDTAVETLALMPSGCPAPLSLPGFQGVTKAEEMEVDEIPKLGSAWCSDAKGASFNDLMTMKDEDDDNDSELDYPSALRPTVNVTMSHSPTQSVSMSLSVSAFDERRSAITPLRVDEDPRYLRDEEKTLNRLIEAEMDLRDAQVAEARWAVADPVRHVEAMAAVRKAETRLGERSKAHGKAVEMRKVWFRLGEIERRTAELGPEIAAVKEGSDIWESLIGQRVVLHHEAQRLKKEAGIVDVRVRNSTLEDADIDDKVDQGDLELEKYVEVYNEAMRVAETYKPGRAKDAAIKRGKQKALKVVSASTRRLARHVGYALPKAATTNRELAESVLKTTSTNFRCRYHEVLAKTGKLSEVDTKEAFWGHAYPEQSVKKGSDEVIVAKPGHLYCGCSLDEELLSFYLWKTVPMTSSNPLYAKDFHPQRKCDIFKPRTRRIQVETFKMFAGLTIDELYELDSSPNPMEPKSMKNIRLRQVYNFVKELKAMDVDIDVVFGDTPAPVSESESE